MSNKQCSEIFAEVFESGCSGLLRTCTCGKTYFNDNAIGWEEGELEDLQEKAKNDPENFVACDHDIGTMEVGEVEIVYDCDCNTARNYERFILSNGSRILKYLRERAKLLRKQADSIDPDKNSSIQQDPKNQPAKPQRPAVIQNDPTSVSSSASSDSSDSSYSSDPT